MWHAMETPKPVTTPPGLAAAVAVLPVRTALALPRRRTPGADALVAATDDGSTAVVSRATAELAPDLGTGPEHQPGPGVDRTCRPDQPVDPGPLRSRRCRAADPIAWARAMHPPHARRRPHVPTRPRYLCRTCAAPWPCQPARLHLLYAYRGARADLLAHLAVHLHRALLDLLAISPNLDPVALSARFLGWVPGKPAERDPPR